MNSEILGTPTDSAFGVVFARLGEDFARHPAMLYEACAYFATFIVLTFVYFAMKKRPNGFILGLMLLMIFTARVIIEPFKIEQADYQTNVGMNVGQLLSYPFIIAALALIIFVWYRYKKNAK